MQIMALKSKGEKSLPKAMMTQFNEYVFPGFDE